MKFNFVVFLRNNQSLLELVEWLHSNPSHLKRFECTTLSGFVVVIVFEGDCEAFKYASKLGSIVVVPKQNGGEG